MEARFLGAAGNAAAAGENAAASVEDAAAGGAAQEGLALRFGDPLGVADDVEHGLGMAVAEDFDAGLLYAEGPGRRTLAAEDGGPFVDTLEQLVEELLLHGYVPLARLRASSSRASHGAMATAMGWARPDEANLSRDVLIPRRPRQVSEPPR